MDVTIPTLSDVVRNPRRKSIDYGLNGLRLLSASLGVPSIQILDRVPRSCSCGLFPRAALLPGSFPRKRRTSSEQGRPVWSYESRRARCGDTKASIAPRC
jgi:hypothetical protein